jgi:hypothetical protein
MTNFSPPNAREPSAGDADRRESGAALVASLARQLALYEQLGTLAHRQGALIGVDDGSPLLAVIAQRQQVIDELQSVAREFESKGLSSATLTAPQRRAAAETNELIAAIRARIFEQDERDRAALRDAKAQVGGELRKLSQGGNALRAYGGSPVATAPAAAPVISRFTDHQG